MMYSYIIGKTALGTKVVFRGPGMGNYSEVHLTVHTESEAEQVCRYLDRAFEAGKKHRSAQLRELLGAAATGAGR